MGFKGLQEKIVNAKRDIKIAIVQPEGPDIFQALKIVEEQNLCRFVLVGSKETILNQANQVKLANYEVVIASDEVKAAYLAMQLIHEGNADILMKGHISTDVLLKAVLNKEKGLRTKNFLSHLAVLETHEKAFLGVTDCGMNIRPNLKEKATIINNAVDFFHLLGFAKPKVGILSANEKANSKIEPYINSKELIQMSKKGDIKGSIVYGPIAFDLAISRRARQIKKVSNKIFSNADILLVPDIVCGNSLLKALIYCADFPSGGIVLGAKCPIVLLSRADTAQEKLNSMLLGIIQCIQS
jgi:phosphate butyryltransferase